MSRTLPQGSRLISQTDLEKSTSLKEKLAFAGYKTICMHMDYQCSILPETVSDITRDHRSKIGADCLSISPERDTLYRSRHISRDVNLLKHRSSQDERTIIE